MKDCLSKTFHLHGAVDSEPRLPMPVMDTEEERSQATFIDPRGDIVATFWSLSPKVGSNPVSELVCHPKLSKSAVFDIISPDLESGPVTASGEICTGMLPTQTPR